MDRRNDIGPDSNPCPPWASSPNVVGATVCATVPPNAQYSYSAIVTVATQIVGKPMYYEGDSMFRFTSPVEQECEDGYFVMSMHI